MRRDHYPDKLQDITYKGDKEGVWAQNRFNKIEVHNEQKTILSLYGVNLVVAQNLEINRLETQKHV